MRKTEGYLQIQREKRIIWRNDCNFYDGLVTVEMTSKKTLQKNRLNHMWTLKFISKLKKKQTKFQEFPCTPQLTKYPLIKDVINGHPRLILRFQAKTFDT